jgi:hypothetical protein
VTVARLVVTGTFGMRALAVVIVLVIGCSSAPTESPAEQRAFYYWRTTFQLSPAEQGALADLHVSRLYLRMFDVEWSDNEPRLIGKLTVADGARVPAGIEVIPVIFLRDEVFKHVDAKRAGELARVLWAEVKHRAELVGFVPRELQLDCDWTDRTRDAYFDLLRQLRATAGISLAATIRLHQVKYRERTGVPPVDRGMLMFYNMGKFSADPEARAIFDAASAERYLARIADYPLPLDAALPIWSWVVHLRDDRVEGLLQSTDPDELASVEFLQRVAPAENGARAGGAASDARADRYVTTRNAFLHGTLLREGDILKVEVTGPAEAMAAATMLAPHLAGVAEPRTISLFDLSERNLTRHGTGPLDQVFRAIR